MTPYRLAIPWFLGGLVLCPGSATLAPSPAQDPYPQIARRNAFGLKSPVPAERPDPPSAPMPKFILTGITTFLKERALLRIQFAATAAAPAREESCILAEGQREGGVELLAIDIKAGTVKLAYAGKNIVVAFDGQSASSPLSSIPAGNTLPATPPKPPARLPTTDYHPVSAEEQVIIMEVLREQNKDNPEFPPLPPTPLTPGSEP